MNIYVYIEGEIEWGGEFGRKEKHDKGVILTFFGHSYLGGAWHQTPSAGFPSQCCGIRWGKGGWLPLKHMFTGCSNKGAVDVYVRVRIFSWCRCCCCCCCRCCCKNDPCTQFVQVNEEYIINLYLETWLWLEKWIAVVV